MPLGCELLDRRLDLSSQTMQTVLNIVEQSMQLAVMEAESFQDRIGKNADHHSAERKQEADGCRRQHDFPEGRLRREYRIYH